MGRTGWIGTIVWLLAAATVLLWPVPVDRGIDDWLLGVLRTLHHRGVPRWVDYTSVEFTANVLFFVPLGVFLVLALVRRIGAWSVLVTIGCGVAVSVAAELAQDLLLPARTASIADVVANTIGVTFAAIITGVAALAGRPSLPRPREGHRVAIASDPGERGGVAE